MTHANRSIDDVNHARPYLALVATPAIAHSRRSAVGSNPYPLSTADCAASDPVLEARVVRQVREDQDDRRFDVPDLLSDKNYDTDMQVYAAAKDHAGRLHDAERLLCEAQNLVGLMRAAIGDECDARAMQSDTTLKIVDEKLRKAHRRVNQHDRCHANLFLAYVDLKDKAEGGDLS